MRFRLQLSADISDAHAYDGEATYRLDCGVLIVDTGDGRRFTYAPGAWHHIGELVELEQPPTPGGSVGPRSTD